MAPCIGSCGVSGGPDGRLQPKGSAAASRRVRGPGRALREAARAGPVRPYAAPAAP
ncbi:hypothetical protein GCM10023329_35910 [Streptomyces sanyensis]|uniref:Uncharacterized protein n=1 Tax=Streptomyces sanyensis TaxID=568869 RepID=A0ABP9AKA8_9ACTN